VTVFLVDSSVLLDVVTDDPTWADWSQGQLDIASRAGELAINPIIYAELSLAYASIDDLDGALATTGIALLEVPRPALFLAAAAFRLYRRRGGIRTSVLPDFFIGAHAAVEGMTLITRDLRRRGWFPTVQVVSP
jgi:predicted nucleic acid-binding protein